MADKLQWCQSLLQCPLLAKGNRLRAHSQIAPSYSVTFTILRAAVLPERPEFLTYIFSEIVISDVSCIGNGLTEEQPVGSERAGGNRPVLQVNFQWLLQRKGDGRVEKAA
jgi:hypothetical protein